MIAIAYNRENPEMVFIIDKVKNFRINNVQVPYYVGILRNTSPVPDTSVVKDFKVRCAAFEIRWAMVPLDVSGATDLNIQPSKTTTPTLSQQTITADKDYTGLGKVIVKATPVMDKTVTPSSSVQVITPNSPAIAMTKVTVNAAPTASTTFSPSTSNRTYRISDSNPSKVGWNTVTINAVTSAIDSDIRPENIKAGVTILGVTGTYTGEV